MRILILLIALQIAVPAYAEISSSFKKGAIVIGPAADAECVTATEGALRWSSTDQTVHMCNGTAWKEIVGQSTNLGNPPNPPAGNGYFVITSGKWNGDLKTAGSGSDGIDGANKLCLSDLTANNWLGKSDAVANGQLDAAHVKAFLCGTWSCPNVPQASKTYYFAVSGSTSRGGAPFTTNGSSQGPGNAQSWFGTNYFNGSKYYWANFNTSSSSLWATSPVGSSCDDWRTSSPTTHSGNFGQSNDTGSGRWFTTAAYCDVQMHLICYVNPP